MVFWSIRKMSRPPAPKIRDFVCQSLPQRPSNGSERYHPMQFKVIQGARPKERSGFDWKRASQKRLAVRIEFLRIQQHRAYRKRCHTADGHPNRQVLNRQLRRLGREQQRLVDQYLRRVAANSR